MAEGKGEVGVGSYQLPDKEQLEQHVRASTVQSSPVQSSPGFQVADGLISAPGMFISLGVVKLNTCNAVNHFPPPASGSFYGASLVRLRPSSQKTTPTLPQPKTYRMATTEAGVMQKERLKNLRVDGSFSLPTNPVLRRATVRAALAGCGRQRRGAGDERAAGPTAQPLPLVPCPPNFGRRRRPRPLARRRPRSRAHGNMPVVYVWCRGELLKTIDKSSLCGPRVKLKIK